MDRRECMVKQKEGMYAKDCAGNQQPAQNVLAVGTCWLLEARNMQAIELCTSVHEHKRHKTKQRQHETDSYR